jgi:hypothetical protein
MKYLSPLSAVVVLMVAGCQKIDYKRTIDVEAGDVQATMFDPPRSEQKVTVTATSSSCRVNLYLVLERDQSQARQTMMDYKSPSGALAGQEKTQDATLEATVPAKQGFAVLIGGASKSTQVQLRVKGR